MVQIVTSLVAVVTVGFTSLEKKDDSCKKVMGVIDAPHLRTLFYCLYFDMYVCFMDTIDIYKQYIKIFPHYFSRFCLQVVNVKPSTFVSV